MRWTRTSARAGARGTQHHRRASRSCAGRGVSPARIVVERSSRPSGRSRHLRSRGRAAIPFLSWARCRPRRGGRTIVCSPPAFGLPSPGVLGGARLSGQRLCRGRAGAIAAMAFGTESIPVVTASSARQRLRAEAKLRRVLGVDDAPAGPSELLFGRRQSRRFGSLPSVVAQAEHDPAPRGWPSLRSGRRLVSAALLASWRCTLPRSAADSVRMPSKPRRMPPLNSSRQYFANDWTAELSCCSCRRELRPGRLHCATRAQCPVRVRAPSVSSITYGANHLCDRGRGASYRASDAGFVRWTSCTVTPTPPQSRRRRRPVSDAEDAMARGGGAFMEPPAAPAPPHSAPRDHRTMDALAFARAPTTPVRCKLPAVAVDWISPTHDL